MTVLAKAVFIDGELVSQEWVEATVDIAQLSELFLEEVKNEAEH